MRTARAMRMDLFTEYIPAKPIRGSITKARQPNTRFIVGALLSRATPVISTSIWFTNR